MLQIWGSAIFIHKSLLVQWPAKLDDHTASRFQAAYELFVLHSETLAKRRHTAALEIDGLKLQSCCPEGEK